MRHCAKNGYVDEVASFNEAINCDYYFQFYLDDLLFWGFIGKLEEDCWSPAKGGTKYSSASFYGYVNLAVILYIRLVFVIASIFNIIAIFYGATTALTFCFIIVILVIFIVLAIPLLVFDGVIGYGFRIEF
ncbi:hypothetical protein AHAS_Ahas11G0218200 [Arachis hypogaea]